MRLAISARAERALVRVAIGVLRTRQAVTALVYLIKRKSDTGRSPPANNTRRALTEQFITGIDIVDGGRGSQTPRGTPRGAGDDGTGAEELSSGDEGTGTEMLSGDEGAEAEDKVAGPVSAQVPAKCAQW